MSLEKQIYLYSIDTSHFYTDEEDTVHKKLLKLYELRKILKNEKIISKTKIENDWDFWRKTVNKLIAEEKENLTVLLNKRLEDVSPRILKEEALKDKYIITLFDSCLTRALNFNAGELTKDLFITERSISFLLLLRGKSELKELYL